MSAAVRVSCFRSRLHQQNCVRGKRVLLCQSKLHPPRVDCSAVHSSYSEVDWHCDAKKLHLDSVLPDAAFQISRLAMRMSVQSSLMPA
jgi:hypothetical protein